jgi:hypothetical protein
MEQTITLKDWLLDTLERVFSTLVQAALVFVLAAESLDATFWRGLAVALVIALVNVLKASLTAWMPRPTTWLADAAVRTLWTFLIALLGSLASVTWLNLLDVNFWQQTALAALVAAGAVAKALLARLRPGTITPASLVVAPS